MALSLQLDARPSVYSPCRACLLRATPGTKNNQLRLLPAARITKNGDCPEKTDDVTLQPEKTEQQHTDEIQRITTSRRNIPIFFNMHIPGNSATRIDTRQSILHGRRSNRLRHSLPEGNRTHQLYRQARRLQARCTDRRIYAGSISHRFRDIRKKGHHILRRNNKTRHQVKTVHNPP